MFSTHELELRTPVRYVSNEAPPQTDQWPRVIQGCLWLIWASVRPRFVRIAASRRVGLEKLLDLKRTPALQSGQRQNRGSPEPENPEAAIEATNLTRSDPTQALGTGHKGHWPLTITNSTLECLGRMQPPPTGERGFSYFTRKTRPFCPYYDSNNKVSVVAKLPEGMREGSRWSELSGGTCLPASDSAFRHWRECGNAR